MAESLLAGIKNRLFQAIARGAPGATTWRVRLHRWRGVKIGEGVWIGYDAILDTSYPHLVTIKDRATVGIRATIIAHMRESKGVTIEEDAVIGPGAIVLPNVVVGAGSIVMPGSVVSSSVPPMTMVQGNPARPVARIGKVMGMDMSLREFAKHLRPI